MTVTPDFTHPAEKWAAAQYAAETIARLVTTPGVVVQAGGCVGLWPLALAAYFAQVYTFEPQPDNYRCLKANVAATPTISAFDYALGERRGCVGMTRPKVGAGLWRVEGEGEIPMVTLDALLGDVAVDAIVLDVEGAEVDAWRGAEQMIADHRPVLWFERLQNAVAIDTFLAAHGYAEPARGFGGDYYSIHTSRVQ